MIKVICQHCQACIDAVKDQKAYLQYNLPQRTIYFKCPECKKTTKAKLYIQQNGYAKSKRLGK